MYQDENTKQYESEKASKFVMELSEIRLMKYDLHRKKEKAKTDQ